MDSRQGQLRILSVLLVIIISIASVIFGSEPQKDKESRFKTQFLPLPVLFYRPQTSLAFGAQVKTIFRTGKNKLLTRPSTISPEVIYTLKKQFITKLISNIYLAENKWHLYSDLDFRKFPDLFYGIGNQTRLDSEEAYTSRSWEIDLSLDRHINKGFHLGFHFHLFNWKLIEKEAGGLLDSGTIPGCNSGTASGLGLRFIYDTRDHIFYPRNGELCEVLYTFYHNSLGSSCDFSCLSINLRKYLPLPRKQVIALQLLLESQYGDVPFILMSQLGGGHHLRGYYTGRFRDKHLLLLQGEWRIPIFWRVSVSVFASVGQVADQLNHLDINNFNYSLGFGLRYLYNKRESINARMDFGWGRNSSGIYMEGDESF